MHTFQGMFERIRERERERERYGERAYTYIYIYKYRAVQLKKVLDHVLFFLS